MILGLGIDICPVGRMAQAVEHHGDRFTERVFDRSEIDYAGAGPLAFQRLAARFAVKEAAMKALGAPEGIGFRDIVVTRSQSGAPMLDLRGAALKMSESLGVIRTHLSITHSGDIAVAVVVLEGASSQG